MGLPDSERIAKIIVDPTRRQHRLRLRAGQALERHRRARRLQDDRRRQDLDARAEGRESVDRLLDDVASIPKNPKTIYAGTLGLPPQGLDVPLGRRRPDAPSGSGLFRSPMAARPGPSSTDDGQRACRRSPGAASRSAVAPSNPNVVYAFVESPRSALYRSDDGGKTWEKRDRSQMMIWRPFYFANLIVDPKNPDRVYKPDGGADRSATTAARASAASAAARTATSTTSGSIPKTRST